MKSPLLVSSLILSVALLACLFPLSYGYYTLVRFATMVLAVCWAYKFITKGNRVLFVIAGALALLFQPFVKIALDKITWNIVDVVVALSILFLVWKYRMK